MTKKKIAIGASILALVIIAIIVNLQFRRNRGPTIQAEAIEYRDLVSIVSASGKIQPKRSVDISADTMGRVTRLVVDEGEGVEAGQFLMQIDPELAASAVQRGEAGLQGARESTTQSKVSVEAAQANLDLSRQNLRRKRELFQDELVPKEVLDQAESELTVRESELKVREAEVLAQGQRLQQEIANLRSARHNLSKVTIDAPMAGLITRLNIEAGETVVVGTMNNPGTVLMTIADMSVIQAELEVDETDIVDVKLGQSVEVAIDALPDEEFEGSVTKIGSSALQGALGATSQQATNFEVEVTLKNEIPGARPGFSCTADITTATREQVIAVPIQALTVREVVRDPQGKILRASEGSEKNRDDPADPPPDTNKNEEEGVYVVRDDEVMFTPIEIGIAGEKYFEVLSGLEEGDQVVTGPFDSVRDLKDGDTVKLEEEKDGGN